MYILEYAIKHSSSERKVSNKLMTKRLSIVQSFSNESLWRKCVQFFVFVMQKNMICCLSFVFFNFIKYFLRQSGLERFYRIFKWQL